MTQLRHFIVRVGLQVLGRRQKILVAHDPGYFTTNILPYDYTPAAVAPRWHTFLHDIFEGDQERISLLQEWFGYMISNSNRYHKILFMLGPARSGKGIIGKVLEQIVGPYNFSGCELHAFASDVLDGDPWERPDDGALRPSTDGAYLYGAVPLRDDLDPASITELRIGREWKIASFGLPGTPGASGVSP